MKVGARPLVLVHVESHFIFKHFGCFLVMHYFPVLAGPDSLLEFRDLLLDALLVEVHVLLHLTLGVHEHGAHKLLEPAPHEL